MQLTKDQMALYQEAGWLLLPELFTGQEIESLKHELAQEFAIESDRRVLEKGGSVVRSVYGSHRSSQRFARLSRSARLVGPAVQILGSPVYVYQFKINAKAAFGGDTWEWHQDFIFWQNEDGVPRPLLINVVVFLDEVNEFNGPMFFLAGSHHEGAIAIKARDCQVPDYQADPAWITNLTADLKYSLDRATMARLVTRYRLVSPKGPAGSVLLFHPNLVHGSSPNISPFDRAICIATYNSVENQPPLAALHRPEFLASRDTSPVDPIAGALLL